MGLLSGRSNNTNTTSGTTGSGVLGSSHKRKHGHGHHHTGTGGLTSHRYETRSRGTGGGLFSSNKGPGTTGMGTNTTAMGTGAGTGRHHAGMNNTGLSANQGNNMMAGTGTGTGTCICPLSSIYTQFANSVAPSAGHAHTQITKGKIERGIGKAFGSRNMAMKGEAKMEQGEMERVAAGHLGDADRLERAAADKRSLAGVGPGVHSTAGNMRGGLKH